MKRRIVMYGIVVLVLGGALFMFIASAGSPFRVLPFIDKIPFLEEAARDVITSVPLRFPGLYSDAHLTEFGVITETNKRRSEAGLSPLSESSLLNQAAEKKLQDMFSGQYFEHMSPSGRGPKDLAEDVGYSYVVIGENLALGNFKDDNMLLEAWMASPGHRENILNSRYRDIGIAVGKGMFQGKSTWLAVQEFGKPSSVCPELAVSLKTKIDSERKRIEELSAEISAARKELDSQNPQTGQEIESYNERVRAYNALIATYTATSNQLKKYIESYNAQVRAYNTCVES